RTCTRPSTCSPTSSTAWWSSTRKSSRTSSHAPCRTWVEPPPRLAGSRRPGRRARFGRQSGDPIPQDPGRMRNASITALELFEQQQDRLALRWAAGRKGGSREIDSGETNARLPSLAGYLNAVYPNKVQILGSEELQWLDSLDPRQRWETIEKIIQFRPLALVISKNQSCPEDLRIAAEESDTPLWVSPRRGHELLNHLQYLLARTLAPRITLHGVFMEIYSIGVLITGDSGTGKSELALELITRGHRLVADDAPEFTQIAPDVLDGTCPELLQDMLELRGL